MSESSTVDFYFDVGSPYTYLAATQIDGLVERTGATVVWKPMLLGGVFQLTGNAPPARVAAKGKWMLSDLSLWAERYGVPFHMNPHFPVNTLSAQRALTAAEELHGQEAMQKLARVFMDGMWVERADMSDGDELAFRVNRAGGDAGKLMRRVGEDELKQKLKDVTQEAVDRGAFGSPSFFVGERLFFGNDRLDLLERHLKPQA
ncbi:MAG: 2-hydroxychromene-2-carboxylate isomerase [Sandaracinaceae bacterium]